MGRVALADLLKKPDAPAMDAPTPAAPEAAPAPTPRRVSLAELGGVPKIKEGPGPDLTQTGSSPAPDQAALAPSPQDKLRAVLVSGADPIDVGLRPGFHPKVKSIQVPTLIDSKTGQIVAHQDLRTGEFVPRDAQPSDIGAYQAMGNAPDFLKPAVKGLHSIEPKDVGRFALEMYFGSKGAAGAARRFGPRIGQVAATALGEFGGGGAASLGAEVFDPSANPIETAAWTATLGGAGSALANGVIKGYNAARAYELKVEPDTDVVLDTLDKLGKKHGKDLTIPLGQHTTNSSVDVAQTMTENSITGRGRVTRSRDAAEYVLQKELDDSWRTLLGGKDVDQAALDNLISDVLERRGEAAKAAGGVLYRKLDETLPDQYFGVDVTEAVARAKELRAEILKSPKSVNRRTLALLNDVVGLEGKEGGDFITMSSLPPGFDKKKVIVSWEQAHLFRSDLLGIGRAGTDLLAGKPGAQAKTLAPLFDDAMERAAVGLSSVPGRDAAAGGSVIDAYRTASDFWRDEVAGRFGDRQIRAIAKADPDRVFDLVTKSKSPERVTKIRDILLYGKKSSDEVRAEVTKLRANALRSAAGMTAEDRASIELLEQGIEAWDGLRGTFLEKTLDDSVPVSELTSSVMEKAEGVTLDELKTTGVRTQHRRSAGTVIDKIRKSGATYKEMFTPQERLNLDRLLKTTAAVQRPAGRNVPGGVGMQLSQWGAIYATLVGHPEVGLLVFGGPAVAGRLLTNKKFQTMMMNASPGMGRTAQQRAKYWTRALAYGISQGAQYEGTDPDLLRLQAERDQNYGPGSPRVGSKTPQPKAATRTATP